MNRLVNCIKRLNTHSEDVVIFWAVTGLAGTLAWKGMMQAADVYANWRVCLCSFSGIKYENLLKHLV